MSRLQLTKNRIMLFLVAVLAIVGTGVYVSQNSQDDKAPTSISTQTVVSPPTVVIETDTVRYPGEEGKNALELLKKHAKVETKTSSLGEYVVSINGNDGSGTKYWLFYVNDKQASMGADAYVSHDSDTIEWRLE